jgi:hypothetical protein
MLEALVAVGLAGNVLQFVQTASSLIVQAREIHKTGDSSPIEEFRRSTISLIEQTTTIKDHLERSSTKEDRLPEDQARCQSVLE